MGVAMSSDSSKDQATRSQYPSEERTEEELPEQYVVPKGGVLDEKSVAELQEEMAQQPDRGDKPCDTQARNSRWRRQLEKKTIKAARAIKE